MSEAKKRVSLDSELEFLEELIGQTSEMIEQLVRGQGPPIVLEYKKWTMYLCLVRQTDNNGVCYSLRWAKYCYADKVSYRMVWYNGWRVGHVPASVVHKMALEGASKFRELDQIGKKLSNYRKELTSKKKRVLGIFQAVRRTEKAKIDAIQADIESLDFDAPVTEGYIYTEDDIYTEDEILS